MNLGACCSLKVVIAYWFQGSSYDISSCWAQESRNGEKNAEPFDDPEVLRMICFPLNVMQNCVQQLLCDLPNNDSTTEDEGFKWSRSLMSCGPYPLPYPFFQGGALL